MADDIKEFIPPPEAPVFEPTDEEFEDPLAFIEKIRPYVEKTGICKIRPPPDWQPPFSVNVDKFRFTPRVQKLNELEATTRVKFNFLDAIAKFWELQGTSLKIPMVDRKNLDIFKLYKTVQQEGGYEFVTRKRKWPIVARKMDCSEAKNAPTVLRNHYEKLLFPYDVFQSGLMTGGAETTAPQPKKPTTNVPRTYRNPNLNTQLKQAKDENFSSLDYESSPALKKLQFKAPGPKMAAVCESEVIKQESDKESDCCYIEGYSETDLQAVSEFTGMKDDPIKLTRRRPVRKVTRRNLQGKFPGFQEDFLCHMCSRGDDEQYLLLCDGCDMSFHTFCLIPPITTIPKGEWRCPKCIAQVYDKPFEIYGFEQSKKEYNLQSFGEMADKFKSDYFKLPAESVPYSVVEKEFWRLVSSVDEEVSVEYGADLHTAVHGSGFPIKENATNSEDEFYANSKWNLTNLASLPKSVLCHINANISGMKVPWLYVGMCFSSFCWHTEDHWSYSINYLHWGEAKTWYGIPADSAEQFENVVHEMAPELFEAHPDLLHHLVTIVNPNILMAKDVPVFRTDQEAGEFVVTFPRGYHAGFNQGYNLAEAVNFAPADWLMMGHRCVEHYRRMRRSIVFSHEELICKVAANPENLDLNMAKAIHEDMALMVKEETQLQQAAKNKGLNESVREAFELLPDDERQCASCSTTCFLSGVTCKHPDKLLSCIYCAAEHCDECSMSDHLLRYRYTLEELRAMLAQLKTRADSFDNWATEVRVSLDASSDNKISLNCLKELVTTAEQSQFPACEILEELKSAVAEAERCATVAMQLVTKKHRTRHTDSLNSNMAAPSLNLEELQEFCRQLQRLPCVIDQAELVQDLMNRVESFQDEAQTLLHEPEPDFTTLKQLFDAGIALDVDLPEIPKLRKELHQCRWLEKVRETLRDTEKLSLELLKALLEESSTLPKKEVVERNAKKLRSLVTTCEEWELKAKLCLQARPRHLMSSVQAIVREALLIPVYLPNISALKEAVVKAHDWSSKVDHVQNDENYPYLEVLEALVMRGRPIPVRLEQLPQMESQVAAALAWRDRTSRTFLRKNSCSTLLEILTSRKEIGVYKLNSKPRKKRDKEKEREKEIIDLSTLEEYIDRKPATQSLLFREAKQKELHELRELRKRNLSRLQVDAPLINQVEHRQFCVCRKGPDGYMLQCDLCKEWFHGACVPLPRIPGGGKGSGKNMMNNEASRTLKYLCPFCHRSRRPRLETILSLLVSLQKLPVRLAEGEALQFLTEYAMNWQDRVRQFIMKGNVSKIYEKINEEEALKQEPNQETSTTVPAVSTATLLQQNMALAISRQTQKILGDPLTTASSTPPTTPQNSGNSGGCSMEIDVVGGQDNHPPTTEDIVEHGNNDDDLRLSKNESDELEELTMEGDTLEVTLDECDTLWKIVHSQRKQTAVNFHLTATKKVDKIKIKRKRKKNEESLNEKENGEKMRRKRGKQKPSEDGSNKTGEGILVKKRKYVRKKKQEDIVDVEGDEFDDDEDDDDDDDEDEPCSAQPCKRPSSEEVDWVQCDCCEQWYHNLCVGISAKKASELDSYVCPHCSNPQTRTAATTTTTGLDNHSTATSPTDSNIDVVSTTPCTTNPPSPCSPKTKTEQRPPVLVSVCSLASTIQTTNNDDTTATDAAVSCA